MTTEKNPRRPSLNFRRTAARTALGLLLTLVFILPLSLPAAAEPTAYPKITEARAAWLYCVTNDTVLFEHNIDRRCFPTGLTKMMTLLVALEDYTGERSDPVTVTREMLSGVSGAQSGIKRDQEYTFRDLLGLLAVNGGNDLATVVAITVAGDTETFVGMMNSKAEQLGMTDTHYTNCTGIHDEKMVTTAADQAKLALYLSRNYEYMEMVGYSAWTTAERGDTKALTLFNKNAFISKYYNPNYYRDDVTGMCVGSTYEGGYAACVSSEKDGAGYLCVVLGGIADEKGVDQGSLNEAGKLLDWAYKNYGFVKMVSATDIITELPVSLSADCDKIPVVAASSVEFFGDLNTDYFSEAEKTVELDSDGLVAPVFSGQKVGTLRVSYGGKEIKSVDLIAKANVSRSEYLYIVSLISSFLHSRAFFAALLIAAAFGVIYLLVIAFGRKTGKRR